MASVREIMTGSAECARTTDTLVDAAKKMRDLDVGALPICGDDDRLHGMITDRDIVVRCVADGGDPSSVTVEEYEWREAGHRRCRRLGRRCAAHHDRPQRPTPTGHRRPRPDRHAEPG